jgi:chromosome segregation ATPase
VATRTEVRLRKCSEHEQCQLQSTNREEWVHTPQHRSIGERFSYLSPAQSEQIERIALAMQRAENNRQWSEETALRTAGLEVRLEDRIETLEQVLAPIADSMLKATHDAEEQGNQLDHTIEQMKVRIARLDAGLEKLADIDALHARMDKVERERKDSIEALELRHKALQASLDDLDARCKATHGKLKKRQEAFDDRLTGNRL